MKSFVLVRTSWQPMVSLIIKYAYSTAHDKFTVLYRTVQVYRTGYLIECMEREGRPRSTVLIPT